MTPQGIALGAAAISSLLLEDIVLDPGKITHRSRISGGCAADSLMVTLSDVRKPLSSRTVIPKKYARHLPRAPSSIRIKLRIVAEFRKQFLTA
jgi:hypothetical protein